MGEWGRQCLSFDPWRKWDQTTKVSGLPIKNNSPGKFWRAPFKEQGTEEAKTEKEARESGEIPSQASSLQYVLFERLTREDY